jgi:ATP-dependent helicase/nuclease subunit A
MADLFVVGEARVQDDGTRPPDWEERERALDVGQSWIVEAPAGSGKTGLLIQRYLKLLDDEMVEKPEQVLAITFTNKAAAEIRDRVLGELESARLELALKRDDAFERESRRLAKAVLRRDAALGWGLLESPRRLKIQTIDSVCGEIAASLPVLSGSGGGQAPVTDAMRLYRIAAKRTLMQLGGVDAALNESLRMVLLHRDGNLAECETLLAEMLHLRDQWGRLIPLKEQELDDVFLDGVVLPKLERALELAVCVGLTRLAEAVPGDLLRDLAALAGEMGHGEGYKGEPSPIALCAGLHTVPGERVEHLAHWRALIHLVVTSERKWRSGFRSHWLRCAVNKGQAARLEMLVMELQENEDVLDAIKLVDKLPPARYPGEQWEVAKALFRVLRRALVELKLVFAERGECDFTEVALQAKDTLETEGGVSDLAVALGMEFRHLLIDEMQDTSTSQYGLIELLTRGWDGHGQTVFLVGDPKQSIYLFRQARVERFVRTMETEQLGELPLGLLRLTANFRSQAGLVNAFNNDFRRLFPARVSANHPEEVPYEEAVAVRPARPGGNSAVWHCDALPAGLTGEGLAEEKQKRRRAEAETIRSVAADWRARPLPDGRSEPWKIAVLVRGRSHLTEIVAALKREDGGGPIPFRAVDIDALNERQEVLDLVALTRALMHPADRVAWLAVLHAPWCGLGLADLHVLSGADDPAWAERCVVELIVERGHLMSDDGCARLERVWPVMQAAAKMRGQLTTAQWVERTWRTLGGDATLNEEALENSRRYLELLDEIEAEAGSDGLVDLRILEERLSKLYAATHAVPGAVELLTIHGAKGLEWDVVMVPGMERRAQTSRGRLLTWDEIDQEDAEAARVVLAPIVGKGRENDELNVWLKGIHGGREAAERKRLFYVVCTRAREELHLFASPQTTNDGKISPEPGSLLKTAWEVAKEHFTVAADSGVGKVLGMPVRGDVFVGDLAARGDDPKVVRPPVLKRLPLSFDARARMAAAARLPYGAAARFGVSATFERPEGSFAARAFGNAMHAFLDVLTQRMAEGAEVDALLREVRGWGGRIQAMLRGDGLPKAMVDRLGQQALAGLTNTLTDPEGAWVLGARDEGVSEFALTAWGERRSSVRLDRMFRAGVEPMMSGTDYLWIVDYKTTRHGSAGIEAFLAGEREKYGPQLAAYARMMRGETVGAGEDEVRVALYYPMLPRLVWWRPESV